MQRSVNGESKLHKLEQMRYMDIHVWEKCGLLEGVASEWHIKREMLSPAYTTRWSELPIAKL